MKSLFIPVIDRYPGVNSFALSDNALKAALLVAQHFGKNGPYIPNDLNNWITIPYARILIRRHREWLTRRGVSVAYALQELKCHWFARVRERRRDYPKAS